MGDGDGGRRRCPGPLLSLCEIPRFSERSRLYLVIGGVCMGSGADAAAAGGGGGGDVCNQIRRGDGHF